ncbi:unnamed protein product [Cladocopium goreaui]|uniref:Uncharacterized protein n=1 Tax=Cladocopium goreaui TaxID=2562237 RepID=A0A9P1C950_9DINO|nr:unnamed protein product [Cladocopium goreaui]
MPSEVKKSLHSSAGIKAMVGDHWEQLQSSQLGLGRWLTGQPGQAQVGVQPPQLWPWAKPLSSLEHLELHPPKCKKTCLVHVQMIIRHPL